jgi:hypothetical protein
MPISYGPQAPGWDPVREQDRAREIAKLAAVVTAADAALAEDGDLAEDIWQELESATAGIAPGSAPRSGPQLAAWDPFREQEVARRGRLIARTVDAARVVATEDGDETEEVWQLFEQALGGLTQIPSPLFG